MDFNFDSNFFVSILFYIIVIGFAIFACRYEIKDLMNQKHLDGTDYERGDSKEEIKEKISQVGRSQNNVIHWRKSYVIAALSSFILILLLKNKVPNGIELASGFLLLYIIIYLSAIIYKKQLSVSSSERIDELLAKV